MDQRTLNYLSTRFEDYYRVSSLKTPPRASDREWGYIPWTGEMIRHQTIDKFDGMQGLLQDKHPRHVYFSGAKYAAPHASSMDEKGWEGTDLLFDIDADHLPSTDEATEDHKTMLDRCTDAVNRLIGFVVDDFGFDKDDIDVVFSGRRGYHIHVRADSIQKLSSDGRDHFVEYVRGTNVDRSAITVAEGASRKFVENGWGDRVQQRLKTIITTAAEDGPDILSEYEGIGDERAETIVDNADRMVEQIDDGYADPGESVYRLLKPLTKEVAEQESVAIDDPVTTDTHRLIRLPGSLHGGTGLCVRSLSPDEIETFDPLTDAIPDIFKGNTADVRIRDPVSFTIGGETFDLEGGEYNLPEQAAIYLMCRGDAEKDPV